MAKYQVDRPTYLAQVLTNYRTINKLSQEEVAAHLGITRSAYAYYELGKTEPSTENLSLLAKLYSAPIEDFFPPEKEHALQFRDKIKEMFKSSAVPARMGALSEDERKLIALFRLADTSGKVKILKDISKNIKQK